jgi:hypothetical protein
MQYFKIIGYNINEIFLNERIKLDKSATHSFVSLLFQDLHPFNKLKKVKTL